MYSQVLESRLFSLWPVLLLYLPVEGSTSATAQPGRNLCSGPFAARQAQPESEGG